MQQSSIMRTLKRFEKKLLIFGLLLLGIYAAVQFYRASYSRAELQRFWGSQKVTLRTEDSSTAQGKTGTPDFRLWSEQRVAAYKASLNSEIPTALAVLKIPAIHLEVPVLQGTDELTLNRGVGHIDGTPDPESPAIVTDFSGSSKTFMKVMRLSYSQPTAEIATSWTKSPSFLRRMSPFCNGG